MPIVPDLNIPALKFQKKRHVHIQKKSKKKKKISAKLKKDFSIYHSRSEYQEDNIIKKLKML